MEIMYFLHVLVILSISYISISEAIFTVNKFKYGRFEDRLRTGENNSSSIFKAYWNIPSSTCNDKFGIHVPLERFNIITNEAQNFSGNSIVIFYNMLLGLYPHYNKTTRVAVNGGLPQLGNLTAHLERAVIDIEKTIPNPSFSGIGIIDWERWRPQWGQNTKFMEIYQNHSIEIVKQTHPDWDPETIELIAKIEFETAAQSYFQSTLRLVKEMRPKALWGYYHFPYCNNDNGPCNPSTVAANNELLWLFKESDILYPSIYLPQYKRDKAMYVKRILNESLRIRDLLGDAEKPIVAYTRFNYCHSALHYNNEDLNHTILQAAQMGLDGVIFWGDDNDTKSLPACQQLQSYVNSTLGPFVLSVQKAVNICSDSLCNGHGSCIGDIMNCDKIDPRIRKKAKEMSSRCTCRCFQGWEGLHCESLIKDMKMP